jgi:hypothetical protein
MVYSDQPELLKPALASDPRVNAEFRSKTQYTPANDGLVVLDRFHPEARPQGNTLWIDPPNDKPPIPIRQRVDHPEGLKWVPDQALTQGLRARASQIESASVFESGPGQTVIAEVDQGPVAVARGNMVVIGFNPFSGSMRYELATPLLLANVLRYEAPDVFRDVGVATQSAGAVSAPVPADIDKNSVQVLTDAGTVLPFNIRDRAVQFFAGQPSRVRVLTGTSERVYSLTLPELWDAKWTPPATARHGIPAWTDSIRRNPSIWPFLAIAGTILLMVEWLMYGASSSRLHIVRRTA